MSDVTVIGLGPMGAALARALLARGHSLTVWNRSEEKAAPLVRQGAVKAASAAEAIAASPLTILCLADYAAVDAVLAAGGNGVNGRAIVSLGSGTPQDARRVAETMAARNAAFLCGAIMVPPAVVGKPEALFFYSGAERVFSEQRGILEALGGDARFLGTDPARALLYNTALLGLYWSTMAGFLHAAALVGTAGVGARDFAQVAREFLAVPSQIIGSCADQIDAGRYPGEAGRLTMDATAMDHLIDASRSQGIGAAVPLFLRRLAQEAIEAGHGAASFAAIVEVLRGKTEAA
ncbi:hypothetical protein VE25_14315 [Devosia geojensis]|uniref:Uncharacterized protein n=1 Tax=Devosia geojensis TaxID=443610 RepID=A0A0F5FQN4_9HYPH|nr:NAD(P)-binding domain-containing protein [Devosia geojensis]KKB11123.1 hypothetical protein VE25_14315 [Devosia geojensis]